MDFRVILDIREKRLAVCATCEFKTIQFGMAVCGKCNCPLSGKATLPLSKCPANKWVK